MIRIVYRWRVQRANGSKFKAAWARTTTAIRDSIVGARGSVLLQSHQDTTEYVTIARWDKLEDWKAFWEDPTQTQMQDMHSLAERISAEAYEEVEDHTV